MVPGPLKEEVLLRDKFLTQSSSKSCRKLKRLVDESGKSLSQVTQNSTDYFKLPYYFKLDLETKRKEGRSIGDHETRPGRKGSSQKTLLGNVFSVDSWGTSGRNTPKKGRALREMSLTLPRPCFNCKDNHWEASCPKNLKSPRAHLSFDHWQVPR